MSFHIEHHLDGRPGRIGTYESLGEATLVALGLKGAPILIIEDIGSVSFGSGEVVAVVLKRGEVLGAPSAEPEWWPTLATSAQQKLLAGGRLEPAVVAEVTEAGGAVAATAWESGPLDEWEMTPKSDHDWVRFEAATRHVRR